MTAQPPSVLYGYFSAGDRPTQQNYTDLIDSSVNQLATTAQLITSDVSALAKLDLGGALTVKASAATSLTGNVTIGGLATVSAGLNVLASAQANFTGNVIVSGALTPAIGIIGTTTNNNAAARSVGEYIESQVAVGSAVSLVNATPKTITSISLTAGDWDVNGIIITAPAGTTTQSALIGSVSLVDNTSSSPTSGAFFQFLGSVVAGGPISFPTGTTRISISGTTTVYLVAQSNFAVSTNSAYGVIRARRVR